MKLKKSSLIQVDISTIIEIITKLIICCIITDIDYASILSSILPVGRCGHDQNTAEQPQLNKAKKIKLDPGSYIYNNYEIIIS